MKALRPASRSASVMTLLGQPKVLSSQPAPSSGADGRGSSDWTHKTAPTTYNIAHDQALGAASRLGDMFVSARVLLSRLTTHARSCCRSSTVPYLNGSHTVEELTREVQQALMKSRHPGLPAEGMKHLAEALSPGSPGAVQRGRRVGAAIADRSLGPGPTV